MKVFKAVFCLAMIFAASLITAQAQQPSDTGQAAAVPRAVVPFYSYDFGDINKGETLAYIFRIKNIGNADLLIKESIPDCGCEVVSADKVIAPGKEGKARVQISTVNMFGNMHSYPVLRTNDPDQPKITFTLKANILASPNGLPIEGAVVRRGKHVGPIFLSPGDFTGLTTATGAQSKIELAISAERGLVKVLRVESESNFLSARVEMIEEGKKYKIVVEPAPTLAPGSYEAGLQVYTDSPALPSFPVGIRVNVVATR